MKKNRIPLVALAALVVVVAVAYVANERLTRGPQAVAGITGQATDKGKAPADKGAPKAPPPLAVEVVQVKPTLVQEDLQAVGSLQSNQSVILRPEVSGRVATIGFRDGQPVKKGQLLVALDSTLNDAEVAQAKAEYDLAFANLKRSEDLARQKFISSSAQETAASNAQVAEARLKLAQARQSKMRILAPFDGVVGIRSISVGDYVRDGADLVNVEDVRVLKVDFRLPERALSQVRAGQPVEVMADALPNERFVGVVEAINPRVDASGRSLELRARLDNPGGKLRPGMFMRVRVIVGERTEALLVPEEAIVPLGGEFYVFTVVNGQARRIPVKIGLRRDARVEILEGLKSGDQVVTAGMRLSRDGQAVRIVQPGASVLGEPPKGDAGKANEGKLNDKAAPAAAKAG